MKNTNIIASFSIPAIKNFSIDYISKRNAIAYASTFLSTRDFLVENTYRNLCESEILESLKIRYMKIIIVLDNTSSDRNKIGYKKDFLLLNSENSVSTISVDIVSIYNFFSQEGLSKLFIDLRTDSKNILTIYVFISTSWMEVVSQFKANNVSITGGSTSRRHIFSPQDLKLAMFIISLEKDKSFKTVSDSFENLARNNEMLLGKDLINRGQPYIDVYRPIDEFIDHLKKIDQEDKN